MMKKLLCTLTLLVFAIGATQAQQEIDVQGNGISIIGDGTNTPAVADDTDFGQVAPMSSSSEHIFTILNTGTAPLTVNPSFTTNSGVFSITTLAVSPVPIGGSTTIGITFNAPVITGITLAQLVIFNNDSDENPYTINLRGESATPIGPEINVTGNTFSIIGDGTNSPNLADGTDFGSVSANTSSIEQIFVIQNIGSAPLTVNPSFTTNPVFAITTPATSPVPAGGSVNIGITFNAPVTPGVSVGSLFIANGDADENPYQINLSGNSVGPPNPEINVQGNGINIIGNGTNTPNASDGTDFGQIPISTSSVEQLFVIQNTGTSPLTVNPSFTTNPVFSITTGAVSPIPAGGSTTIGITFNAPGTAGVTLATLFINNGDSDENPYQINLRAESIIPLNPEINVQGNGITIIGNGTNVPNIPDGTDFGSVLSNTSSTEQIFVIQNTGTAPLIVNPSVTSNPVFAVTTAAVSPVPIGGSTTIGITFNAPIVLGLSTGTLFISNSDADENPYQINLRGESTAISLGVEMDVTGNGNFINDGAVTTSVTNDTDYGSVDVSTGSVTHTFTIENNGTSVLNLTDPSPYVVITGADAADFTLLAVPSTPIASGNNTTFSITFDPTGSALTTRNATVSIANNDPDEDPYDFAISGTAIDANTGSPLMITQYYEGAGNDQWIEVKNISTQTITAGVYNLALYVNTGTREGVINVTAPVQSVGISGAGGAIVPGEVILFRNNIGGGAPALPSGANLGSAHVIPTLVCNFTGNDVILISTSTGTNCYNDRIDIVGVIPPPTGFPPQWGQNKSLIKGCGTTQQPSLVFNINNYIELFLDEVNTADADANIALGTQLLGSTVWTTSWSNGTPGRTRNAIISGTYNATDGSFGACDLTVNGTLNFNSGTSNFVEINDNLTINGTFTLGDQESLYTVNVLNPGGDPVSISGSITKFETTTSLNDSDDYTYWSSPVENENMSSVFSPGTYQQTRLFYWDQTVVNADGLGGNQALGEWIPAAGLTMRQAKGYISQSPVTGSYPLQATVSFSGTPNNGTIDLDASGNDVIFNNNANPNDDLNLVGNPYPSAIDADEFISDGNNAVSINGTIWFWTHNTPNNQNPTGEQYTNDDYASYNLLGSLSGAPADSGGVTPNGIIGSGQGFMVQTNSPIQKVSFTDGMRIKGQNTQFFRGVDTKNTAVEERDRIWLNLESSEGGAFSQILVGFVEDATDGFDRAYDGIKISEGWINLYSKIDTLNYGIQGLSAFSMDKKVPLAFKSYIDDAAVTYTISIDRFEGVLRDNDIYLVDNELNVTHDLKQGPYNFSVSSAIDSNDGYYDGNRFSVQFTKATLGIDDLELNNDFVIINEENALLVKSNSIVSELKMYDITGRLLVNMLPNESEFRINTNNIRKGTVLILNTTFENGTERSKKAIKY